MKRAAVLVCAMMGVAGLGALAGCGDEGERSQHNPGSTTTGLTGDGQGTTGGGSGGGTTGGGDTTGGGGTTDSCDTTRPVTYSTDMKPIFDAYCTRCHSSAATNRHGAPRSLNYDTYAAASRAASDGLDEVHSGSMPPSGDELTDAETCTYEAWVAQGKPN